MTTPHEPGTVDRFLSAYHEWLRRWEEQWDGEREPFHYETWQAAWHARDAEIEQARREERERYRPVVEAMRHMATIDARNSAVEHGPLEWLRDEIDAYQAALAAVRALGPAEAAGVRLEKEQPQ